MDTRAITTSFGLQITQIAWVAKDVEAVERFYRETMGIGNLSKTQIIRLKEFEGTYYGEPCDAENLVSMAYTGGPVV